MLTFTIAFHTPFRIGTGYGREGVGDTFDPKDPLPASSLKGVMRAAAKYTLALPSERVDAVFGQHRQASPWSWSSARPVGDGDYRCRTRVRVRIDDDTHTAFEDHLAGGDELWRTTAAFDVRLRGFLGPDDVTWHELVLVCSAQAVAGLGSDRRRGLGWVSIRCDGRSVDRAEVDRLRELGAGVGDVHA